MNVIDVDICNQALTKLGVEPIVTVETDLNSVTASTKPIRFLKARYLDIRNNLLANFWWNFAIKKATLVQDVSTPTFGYEYNYILPTDFLRLLYIDNEDKTNPYNLEGEFLASDSSSVKLAYISKESSTYTFSPMFRNALIYLVASDLAYPLVQSTQLALEMRKMAQEELREARSIDSQQGTPPQIYDDDWLNSRDGGDYGVHQRGYYW